LKCNTLEIMLDRLEAVLQNTNTESLNLPTNVVERIRERHNLANFVREVGEKVPDNLPLRFHGTSLSNLAGILESGNLSSSIDRTGESTSLDEHGEFSVSTSKDLESTIGNIETDVKKLIRAKQIGIPEEEVRLTGFIDLGQIDKPLGVTFVILPVDEADAEMGKLQRMKPADLHKPQFLRLLGGNEELQTIRDTLKKAGFNENLAITYHDLIPQLNFITHFANENFPYLQNYKPQQTSSFSVY
jgi:hypothetical protein